MSFLGIDFGQAKIGLALSDGELASPLPVLREKNPEKALSRVITLVSMNNVDKIVIGIPSPDSIGAGEFANKLERFTGLPVFRLDETMTTNIATKKTKKAAAEDSVVAAILLQEYLDKSKGEKLAI